MSKRVRGGAVVFAMLVAAIAAAVAATVFADQQRWSSSVLHRRDQAQAQALALAAVQWARQTLYDERAPTTNLAQPWAVKLPPIPLDNGEVRGAIEDAEARLNVNALADSGPQATIVRRRLEQLFAQRGLSPSLLDGIAEQVVATAVVRTAELADAARMSADAVSAVAPFVAALPRNAPVNVNTASAEVLAAILPDASRDAIAEIVADRAQRPYSSIAEFRGRLPRGVSLASEERLAVRSDHFIVTIEARQNDTLVRSRAQLQRGADGWPVIAWQVTE